MTSDHCTSLLKLVRVLCTDSRMVRNPAYTTDALKVPSLFSASHICMWYGIIMVEVKRRLFYLQIPVDFFNDLLFVVDSISL